MSDNPWGPVPYPGTFQGNVLMALGQDGSAWSAVVVGVAGAIGLGVRFVWNWCSADAREYRRRAGLRAGAGSPIADEILEQLVSITRTDAGRRAAVEAKVREAFLGAPEAFASSLREISPEFICSFELYAALCEGSDPPQEMLAEEFDRLLSLSGQGDGPAREAIRAFELLDLEGGGALQDRIAYRVLEGLRSAKPHERQVAAHFACELVGSARDELTKELRCLAQEDPDPEVASLCQEALQSLAEGSGDVGAS